jgi:hypothetical protein
MTTRPDIHQNGALDELLAHWHRWQNATATGGPRLHSAVVGNYRTSRQYDDMNGALESALDNVQMRAVDFAVGQMTDPHRTAIYCLARALARGLRTFTSPRLPSAPAAREVIVVEARGMLTRRLQSAGVLPANPCL